MYARLDQIRGPEDAAADLMELWGAAESAMRAMLGGSTLGGQALVRELRQRGLLNLEQANAIASFWDAKARADDITYKPTLTDVGYARTGFNELQRAITEAPAGVAGTTVPPSPYAPGGSGFAPSAGGMGGVGAGSRPPEPAPALPPPAPVVPPPAAPSSPVHAARRRPALLIGGLVALLVILGIAAVWVRGSSGYDREMASAIDLMQSGRNESARSAFSTIAREYPDKGRPHVFLSRLSRIDGDVNTARQELVTAIRLEPSDELAQREMGVFLISQGNYDLARNFLVRAVTLNGRDSAAQGYLGCALYKLNRVEEAQRFLSRAGTGSWSSCMTTPTPPSPTTSVPPITP